MPTLTPLLMLGQRLEETVSSCTSAFPDSRLEAIPEGGDAPVLRKARVVLETMGVTTKPVVAALEEAYHGV